MTTETAAQVAAPITMETAETQEQFIEAFSKRHDVAPEPVLEPEVKAEEVVSEESAAVEAKVEELAAVEAEVTTEEPEAKPDSVLLRTKKAIQLMEAAKADAAALRAELAAIKAAGTVAQAPAPAVQLPADAPVFANYNGDTEKYVRDMTAYQVNLQLVQHQVQEQESKRISKFMETTPDFADERDIAIAEVKAGLRAAWTPEILSACAESENGVQLQYHLMKHPEEVDRLNALTPIRRALELGKLEAGLAPAAEVVKVAPRTSNAPAPLVKVSGTASVSRKFEEIDNQAAFEAEFRKKYGRR